MASLSVTNVTTSSISVSLSGLYYPPANYDGFRYYTNLNGDMVLYAETMSTSYQFTGLSPSTTYPLVCHTQYQGGGWIHAGSTSGTTLAPAHNENCTTSITNVTTSSFVVNINGLQFPPANYSGIQYIITGEQYNNTIFDASSNSFLFDGLYDNSTYSVSTRVRYAGVWYNTGSASTTTLMANPPSDPTLYIDVISTNYISAHSSESIGAVAYEYEVTTPLGSPITTATSSSAATVVVLSQGIQPGTYYVVSLLTRNANYEYSNVSYQVISTNDISIRPANFTWSTPKSYHQPAIITETEWNTLTARVTSFASYKGVTLNELMPTVITGEQITAINFNKVIRNLILLAGYMASPQLIPSQVNQGDEIKASYLNNMVSALNSIP